VPWIPKAKPSELFPFAYTFKWIKSIDELKEVLSQPTDYMGFDTETTGLNQEEIDLVGYSFCLDGITAYYVPVWHYNFELGEEAVELIYEKMCNTKTVAMFNMRYDVRVLEYRGYTTKYKQILEMSSETLQLQLEELKLKYKNANKECPYKTIEDIREKHKLDLSQRPYIKYDMSKVNTVDVQAIVYLVDTNIKYPSLKSSEEWYLGWRGASFEQTIMNAENENAIVMKKDTKTGEMKIKDMNFFYLSPEEAYEYAAVDALGTYLLGIKLQPFYEEAKMSGQLDVKCLMPLTRFENELTLIDVDKLKEYSKYLEGKINEVQNRCWTTAGQEFNLGSSKDCNKVLKSLNIHTGVTTKRGEMSTSKESIAGCLERLPPGDPARQFLTDLTDYGTYVKQKSSYVDNIIEMAESNKHHKNRLRFSYKTTEVPSGRLAAGGDKKNTFFAGVNIQNITKPHVTNHFCIPEEVCKEYYPLVINAIDKSGTREEARTPLYYMDKNKIEQLCKDNDTEFVLDENDTRWSYRIFGWVFSDKPWLIPGEEEYVVEGFNQKLNIRSTFLPDDDYYWVSLDFNAQEVRIPAIWSGEPAWVNAFSTGKDVHKSTACAIWGEENYTKDKRKMAKGANFGILYGMEAHNFAQRFGISMGEAQEFVDQFKAGLPVLTNWINAMQKLGEKQGYINTLFGRPRRVKSWFDTGDWSWIAFAKRTIVNSAVQGTGADILKIVLIRLFDKWYNNTKTGPLTKMIRFKSTIHDEVNYQIYKDKEHNGALFRNIAKETMKLMRVKLPQWPFPMEVGLSIGNRWGQSVDFAFDSSTLEILGPKKDPISDGDICKALGIKKKEEEHVDKNTDREDQLILEDISNMTIEY
jgi:DNA polymerase I-like protein with 3'-5' exonuclease and polymerase domains